MTKKILSIFVLGMGLSAACSSDSSSGNPDGGGAPLPPAPSCMTAAGGSATVSAPELFWTLKDRYEEAWLGSAAVADLDGDGKMEVVVPRGGAVVTWHADGSLAWKYQSGQARIWASPVVADFTGDAKLEVAVAAYDRIVLLDST